MNNIQSQIEIFEKYGIKTQVIEEAEFVRWYGTYSQIKGGRGKYNHWRIP